ncbi:MAG: aminotransferase class V-fold PLP-dependent enzyme [Leptospiraceae bacterium]|nr:aminotransferase class V-fold PLP-dependent enzyme [Leptospiraceae bacterium]MDW7977023.1 aminotransferase class V-fold PLP-dependent enzyme [Leptospiraceae bacterium]
MKFFLQDFIITMIYLDYNSTHPPLEFLRSNLESYYSNWANPSGISFFSQKNFAVIEQSRRLLRELLQQYYHVETSRFSFVFASTGTEAVHQMVATFFDPQKPYAIVSPYEHDSFYGACEILGLKTLLLPAYPTGRIEPKDVFQVLEEHKIPREKISFVGCIAVSNETGVIQPIKELAEVCHQLSLPLISDTIQIGGKRPWDFSFLGGFTINGHKIGGGLGASVVATLRTPKTLFKGGLQENEYRAGTENFFAIKNLVDAFSWQMQNQEAYRKNEAFQKQIEDFLIKECNAIIVGKDSLRIPTTTYAIFPELSIENMDFLFLSLDQEGIVVSTGSSCKSRTRQPSTTLLRMGFSEELALQALRFSTGIFTTQEEIDVFIEKFKKIYKLVL